MPGFENGHGWEVGRSHHCDESQPLLPSKFFVAMATSHPTYRRGRGGSLRMLLARCGEANTADWTRVGSKEAGSHPRALVEGDANRLAVAKMRWLGGGER